MLNAPIAADNGVKKWDFIKMLRVSAWIGRYGIISISFLLFLNHIYTSIKYKWIKLNISTLISIHGINYNMFSCMSHFGISHHHIFSKHEKSLYIGDEGTFVYWIFQQFVGTNRGVIFNLKAPNTKLFRLGEFYFCMYFLFLAPSSILNLNKKLCISNEIS